jgi:cell division protein FtsI (penicillin-binding protein 3)
VSSGRSLAPELGRTQARSARAGAARAGAARAGTGAARAPQSKARAAAQPKARAAAQPKARAAAQPKARSSAPQRSRSSAPQRSRAGAQQRSRAGAATRPKPSVARFRGKPRSHHSLLVRLLMKSLNWLVHGTGKPAKDKPIRISVRHRQILLTGGLAVLCVSLLGRLIWVGVIGADEFAARSASQREIEERLPALRGSIMDRNGEVLAMSSPTSKVSVDPSLVSDSDQLAAQLGPLLGVDPASLMSKLEAPDSKYQTLAHNVDPEVVDQINALKAREIVVEYEPKRTNVNGDVGASVLGRLTRVEGKATSGIENKFDSELAPTPGLKRYQRGKQGRTIPGSEKIVASPRSGADLMLTLDVSMQFAAEQALLKQCAEVQAKGGVVVLGRPKTGEILAMASVVLRDGKYEVDSQNKAIVAYEPGSVMKLVTVATAFDTGAAEPNTTLVVPDSITLYDREINDSHKHATEIMTIDQIFAQSSNVGTIKVAQMVDEHVGVRTLLDYHDAFGFGRKTNLSLPYEEAGIVKQRWNGTDIGSVPIGQSITATPLQVWSAYNVVANDGLYVPPRILLDQVDAEGRHSSPTIETPHRVIAASTAGKINTALQLVIEEGTGQEIRMDGFQLAGKTGTAYKVIPGHGYGSEKFGRRYASSFVGFFPASKPEISIMVMIDEPAKGLHTGSRAAGPVFETLANEAVRRYSIAGDAGQTTAKSGRPIRSTPTPPAPTTTAVAPTTTIAGAVTDPAAATTPAAAAAPAAASAPVASQPVGAPANA